MATITPLRFLAAAADTVSMTDTSLLLPFSHGAPGPAVPTFPGGAAPKGSVASKGFVSGNTGMLARGMIGMMGDSTRSSSSGLASLSRGKRSSSSPSTLSGDEAGTMLSGESLSSSLSILTSSVWLCGGVGRAASRSRLFTSTADVSFWGSRVESASLGCSPISSAAVTPFTIFCCTEGGGVGGSEEGGVGGLLRLFLVSSWE